MKKLIFILALLFEVSAQALTPGATMTISCAKNNWRVVVLMYNLTEPGTSGAEYASYFVYQNGQEISDGRLNKLSEGYTEFLNSYVLGFESDNKKSVVGIAIPGLKNRKHGKYAAKSNLAVTTPKGLVSGSTVDCLVEM